MKNINFKKLTFIAFVGISASCKQTNVNPSQNLSGTRLSEVNISVTGTKPMARTEPQGKGIYNFLGYGYDITGKYADTSSVKSPVIDVAVYDRNNPDRVIIDESKQAGANIINPKNAADFALELSAGLSETAGSKFFKGSIISAFPDQDALSKKYIYARYAELIQQKRVRYDKRYDLLKIYLYPQFTADIKNLNAADLVKKYGTHVLSDIILGAAFNVLYQASPSFNQSYAVDEFSYEFKKVFGLFSGSLDPVDASSIATLTSPKFVYEVIGADPSKLKVNTTAKGTTVDIAAWHLSSTEDNAVFINISENGLIPLYDLIDDTEKKAAVKSIIATYLQQQAVKLEK